MGADVSVHRNRRGGLRADLPAGPLTFGKFYDVFPFDNRLVALTLRAAGLARVFAAEIQRGRRGVLGVSGIDVRAVCTTDGLRVDLFRGSGRPVQEGELLLVATTDSLAQGTVFAPAAPAGGFRLPDEAPIAREVSRRLVAEEGRTTAGRSVPGPGATAVAAACGAPRPLHQRELRRPLS